MPPASETIKYRIGIMPGPWPPGREGGDFLWALCDFLERSDIDSIWLSDRLSSPAPVPEVMTTLAAVLSSLQMGFRTLAIQKRSSEVWNLLAAVKNEFGKFGDSLSKVKERLLTLPCGPSRARFSAC